MFHLYFKTFPGTTPNIEYGGTFFVTSDPVAITDPLPIVTPCNIVTFIPTQLSPSKLRLYRFQEVFFVSYDIHLSCNYIIFYGFHL